MATHLNGLQFRLGTGAAEHACRTGFHGARSYRSEPTPALPNPCSSRQVARGPKPGQTPDREATNNETEEVLTTALDPVLLPFTARTLPYSFDVPSQPEGRPFGLAHTTAVPDQDIADVSHLRYDPARQLNVDTTTGQPITEPGHVIQMATHTDTRYDNQWFEDKD